MRANDLLPQADLLLEMLDAQDSFDLNASFLSLNNNGNHLSSQTTNFSQNLTTPTNNNNNNPAPSIPQSAINNSKVSMDSSNPLHYNQKQSDNNQASNMDDSNGKFKKKIIRSFSIVKYLIE